MKYFSLSLQVVFFLCAVSSMALAKDSKAVAKVDDRIITEQQLVARMLQRLPSLSFHRKFTKEMMDKLKNDTLQKLIDEELLYQEAKRRSLLPTFDRLKQAKTQMVAAKGGPQKFGEVLKRLHMTWQDHWKDMERQLAVRAVIEKLVLSPAKVTEKEVQAYYDSSPSRFKRPPEVKVMQMLFKVEPNAPTSKWDEAQAQAKDVATKIRAGASMDTLSKKAKSQPSVHARAGDLGWVHQGRLVPELDEVAFKLKPGQTSSPVRTLEGFVILKVNEARPARQMTFNEIAPRLKEQMVSKRIEEKMEELLKRLHSKTKIVRF